MAWLRYNKLRRGIAFCALFLCLGSAIAHATGVRMLNGEFHDGKVQLIGNEIAVITQTGTTRIELADLLEAAFQDNSQVKPGVLPPGVLLTNGSLVAGNINTFTDPIKIGNMTFPLSSAAWVVFQPIARDKITQPSGGRTGVILPSGDFFPGVIAGIKDDKVAINSPLFGPQRFSIRGRIDICALVLRDVQDGGTRYEISTQNGSIYAVNDIKIAGDFFVINDPNFGNLKINKGEVVTLRVAPSQYQYLAGQKPDRVDVPAGADSAAAVQVPQDAARADDLQTAVNAAVTYTVPKGFVTFASGASVPKDMPVGARYTFAVYGDGKFLLVRTSALGPGDIAQHISVPVGNLHTITIRIEPASAGVGPGSAEWIQPIFLRQ
jgi:hypothetical protein